jgi:putative ABC transport system permease protein
MLGVDQMLYIPLKSILLTAALGIGGSILFCYPLLNRIKSLNPATLFQEDASPSLDLSKKQMLGFLPVIIVYWILAIFQANSILMGSLFVAIFLASSLVFAVFCWVAINFIAKKGFEGPLVWRMAALNLARHKTATIACFLAISLGAMLLNIIPQIRDVVTEELSRPKGVDAPSLFLFDIQDEQVDPLRQLIKDNNADMNYLSPLIQARLLKIDGEDVGQRLEDGTMETRESERSDRMRNRTYNLSYRGDLASS